MEGEEGVWGGSYIQRAEIDRERKRWIIGGREIVRDLNGYMAGWDNTDPLSGFWQMLKELRKKRAQS